MKMNLVRVSVLALAAAAGVYAQSSPVRFDVPFDFEVSNKALKAGPYSVSHAPSGIMIIRSMEGTGSVMLIAGAVRTPHINTEAKMVFRKYGDRYFLSQVLRAGSHAGSSVPFSRREQEVATRYATGRDTTVIAAR